MSCLTQWYHPALPVSHQQHSNSFSGISSKYLPTVPIMALLSVCRFLISRTWPETSPTSSSYHPPGTLTLTAPYSSLRTPPSCSPSAFVLVRLRRFFHLSIPILQDQLENHLPMEIFSEAPRTTPCLRIHAPSSVVITAPKKCTSIFFFFLISLPSEPVNSSKIRSTFSFLKTSGIVL